MATAQTETLSEEVSPLICTGVVMVTRHTAEESSGENPRQDSVWAKKILALPIHSYGLDKDIATLILNLKSTKGTTLSADSCYCLLLLLFNK